MPSQSRRASSSPTETPPQPTTAARAPGRASNSAQQDRLRGAQSAVGTAGRVGGYLAGRVTGTGGGDIRREGTVTDPKGGGAVSLDRAMSEAKAAGQTFGDWLMARYAFQPSAAGAAAKPGGPLRFFSPGLNTPEPMASSRTAYYADKLNQPMVHLHNGTNLDPSIPGSENIDYATAMATRNTGRSTALIDSMVRLLKAALTGAEPQDVHAILYSDSTIAGSRAIAIVRQQMVAARAKQGGPGAQEAAVKEVDALLRKHLFVELHGNVAADLPRGPRYVAWADRKDSLTHKPLPGGGRLGLSGAHRDADADVLYMDYDGPYRGADAHNLQAVGVHAVRQTWWANGVQDSQGLHDKARRGEPVRPAANIQGDKGKLWNPPAALGRN